MQSALDISKYVIHQYWKNGTTITNLKLQKILYYVQGYVSKFCNEPAFPQAIYNWPYGPVVPDVYYEYNENQARPIPGPEDEEFAQAQNRLKLDQVPLRFMEQVIDKSYRYSASELVRMTHEEDPWKNSHPSKEIPYEQIARYFRSHDPLKLAEAQR